MKTDQEVSAKFWNEEEKIKELLAELPEQKQAPARYLYNEGVAVDEIRKDMEKDVDWYWSDETIS